MQSQLSCYQYKISHCICKMFYASLLVTTEPNPTTESQKTNRRKSKHTATETHQSQRKTAREEGRNKGTTQQPENN